MIHTGGGLRDACIAHVAHARGGSNSTSVLHAYYVVAVMTKES